MVNERDRVSALLGISGLASLRWVVATVMVASGLAACTSSNNGGSAGSPTAGASAGGSPNTGGSAGSATTAGSAGGVAAGGSSAGAAGNAISAPPDLGQYCAGTGCNVCATKATACASGYCAFESRYLPYESYCTMACAGNGAACPAGYECVQDEFETAMFWCLRGPPKPPADFGNPCSGSINVGSCLLQDATRECAETGHGCTGYCVRGPGGAAAICSTDCSSTVPCPDGYDCRDNPTGSTSERTCFKSYTAADVIGSKCVTSLSLEQVCASDPASCVVRDTYGLCDCLVDKRDSTTIVRYCTAGCTADCPTGYECGLASVPGTEPAAMYCYKTQ